MIFMTTENLASLAHYPKTKWDQTPNARWGSLCESLCNYVPPRKSLSLRIERKWELVSALQKSVRRGDKQMALRLASAMDSMPAEYAYFWRRLCVTACEDVGPADDTLAAFVTACSTVFSPKKTGGKNYDLFCFFVEQMCALSTRSRVYCSYSIIEAAVSKASLPELSAKDEEIILAITRRKASVQAPRNLWEEWQKKNDWRAEGMLKFVGLTLSGEMYRRPVRLPPPRLLFDLPSYCYDMHTRVGLETLKRFVAGIRGAEGIRDFFKENRLKSAHRALGVALFFSEGGRIRSELIYDPLSHFERGLIAYQSNLPLYAWMNLQTLVEEALEHGLMDQVREEVLEQFYGRKNCNQLQNLGTF